MNWRTLDLNLLVVFDAVADTRSATRAAERLNMTQPAVSHALTRLRAALGDELFLRTPDGMAPTLYAENLAGPVRAALAALGTALQGAEPFDPTTASRSFTLAADNHAALVLAAPLAALVATEAPGVSLHVRPSGTLDVPGLLDRGELDMALGRLAAPGDRFADRRLFADGFAVLLRRGHPAGSDGAISLTALAGHPHLELSSTGDGTEFIDEALDAAGLRRRIAFTGPLLAAPAVLAGSDMVAVTAARVARALAAIAPLQVLALPFDTPQPVSAMLWHRRQDAVPAHRWLRATVLRVARMG